MPTIEKIDFHLDHVDILGKMNARKQEKRNIDTWELENYAENYSEYICFQLQSQQWGVRHQIQIKGFSFEVF